MRLSVALHNAKPNIFGDLASNPTSIASSEVDVDTINMSAPPGLAMTNLNRIDTKNLDKVVVMTCTTAFASRAFEGTPAPPIHSRVATACPTPVEVPHLTTHHMGP